MGISQTLHVIERARRPAVLAALMRLFERPQWDKPAPGEVSSVYPHDERILIAAVNLLIQFQDAAGHRLLLRVYDELPQAARDLMASRIPVMREELTWQLRNGRESFRRRVLDILTNSTSTDTLPLLAEIIQASVGEERERATTAFIRVVGRFAHEYGDHKFLVEVEKTKSPQLLYREQMETARDALRTMLRSRAGRDTPEFVRATLAVGEDAYIVLMDLLRDGEHTGAASARAAALKHLAAEETDACYRFLFAALGDEHAAMRKPAASLLASRKATSRDALVGFLRSVSDERMRELARLNRGCPWLLPLGSRFHGVRPEVLVICAEELDRADTPDAAKAPYWRVLADCPIPEVSKRAVAALEAMGGRDRGAATEAMTQLLDSRNENVQVAAVRHLGSVRVAGLSKLLAPKLMAEASDNVRTVARRVIARATFDQFLESWDRLDDTARRTAGRAAIAMDADVVIRLVGELNEASVQRRLRALDIVQTLGTETRLARHLVTLAKDSSAQVRAAVAAPLVKAATAEASSAVAALLHDPDADVQIAAIDALLDDSEFRPMAENADAFGASVAATLEPLLRSDIPRVRSRAATAVYLLGDGDQRKRASLTAAAMLGDTEMNARMLGAAAVATARMSGGRLMLDAALAKETSAAVKKQLEAALAKLPPSADTPSVMGAATASLLALAAPLLFAEDDKLPVPIEANNPIDARMVIILGGFVVLVVLVLILIWLRTRPPAWQATEAPADDNELHNRLCSGSSLNDAESDLMRDIADRLVMGNVVAAFVDVRVLERAAAERPEKAGTIGSIRARIFA
jgi:hypothetical protein